MHKYGLLRCPGLGFGGLWIVHHCLMILRYSPFILKYFPLAFHCEKIEDYDLPLAL